MGLGFCLPQIKFPHHEMRFLQACSIRCNRITAGEGAGGGQTLALLGSPAPTRCSPPAPPQRNTAQERPPPISSSSSASSLTLSSNLTYQGFVFWGRKPLWGDFCCMQEVREHGAAPGPALVAWCQPHGGRTSISSRPPLHPRGGERGSRGCGVTHSIAGMLGADMGLTSLAF